jgi:signal transduction histidine kinase
VASRVLLLDPGTRGSRVGEVSGDFEVSLIATAFDRYLDQLDAFVIREQAFTGDVSHELRTPLATVLSAAQLLLADPDLTAVVRTRVLRIERAAQRMHELAEAMLFLARERRPGGTQVCALEQVLQDVVDSYRDAALRRGLELRLKIQCTGMVVAPPGMVTSVIGNLIGNAVDHAGRGVVEVELGRHVLTVRDEGPGIAAGDASHMFERGYKGSDSRGFGLGLALVKRICDHLGWALEIDSATGRGTIVSVRFAEVG